MSKPGDAGGGFGGSGADKLIHAAIEHHVQDRKIEKEVKKQMKAHNRKHHSGPTGPDM